MSTMKITVVDDRCQKPCEVYSRVSGYHRPVKNWNAGKREEFRERKEFKPEMKN